MSAPKCQMNLIAVPPVDTMERLQNALVSVMTRKDKSMDWDQIEIKWAVMARRIRADVQCGKADDSVLALRHLGKTEGSAGVVVKQSVAASTAITQKREPVSTR